MKGEEIVSIYEDYEARIKEEEIREKGEWDRLVPISFKALDTVLESIFSGLEIALNAKMKIYEDVKSQLDLLNSFYNKRSQDVWKWSREVEEYYRTTIDSLDALKKLRTSIRKLREVGVDVLEETEIQMNILVIGESFINYTNLHNIRERIAEKFEEIRGITNPS